MKTKSPLSEITKIPDNFESLYVSIQKQKLWGNIHRMAKDDEGMADLLNRCIEYYYLKGGK